jgi:hypothetical protein
MMQKLRICAGFVEAGCGALAKSMAGIYPPRLFAETYLKIDLGETRIT